MYIYVVYSLIRGLVSGKVLVAPCLSEFKRDTIASKPEEDIFGDEVTYENDDFEAANEKLNGIKEGNQGEKNEIIDPEARLDARAIVQ